VQYRSIAILFPPPSRDWLFYRPDWQQNGGIIKTLEVHFTSMLLPIPGHKLDFVGICHKPVP
jgi:hypothetical protein